VLDTTASNYRGRFAPSPTGPLHMGSLIAALASYLDARHHGGQWLLRMEDLDPPREQPGAADAIVRSLQAHGLDWDGDLMYQSARSAAYDAALAQLARQQRLFRCDCTRQMLGPDGCCGGRCAPRQAQLEGACSLRVTVPATTEISFQDVVQGSQRWPLGRDLPDFVVRRKDQLYAYQLAVAVDDAAQGITHVIRGSDLLDSTPRQLFLMDILDLEAPRYGHIPVITGPDGLKLSKQNGAAALVDSRSGQNLREALAFLRQPAPPAGLESPRAILDFARTHWDLARIPRVMGIAGGGGATLPTGTP
jgi:glutamyl-Q tRNA(Asp) synthetase